ACNHAVAVLDVQHAGFHIEGRVTEHRIDGKVTLADVQGYAGVALEGVPVRMVLVERALGRDLGGGCLELLEADPVRPIALQPLAQLRGAGPNAVDVPGRDFHAGMISP